MKRRLKTKFVDDAGFALTLIQHGTHPSADATPLRAVLALTPDGRLVRQVEWRRPTGLPPNGNASAGSPPSSH